MAPSAESFPGTDLEDGTARRSEASPLVGCLAPFAFQHGDDSQCDQDRDEREPGRASGYGHGVDGEDIQSRWSFLTRDWKEPPQRYPGAPERQDVGSGRVSNLEPE